MEKSNKSIKIIVLISIVIVISIVMSFKNMKSDKINDEINLSNSDSVNNISLEEGLNLLSTDEANIVSDGSFDGNVNTPQITDGMSIISWTSSGKEYKPSYNYSWYNYKNNKWANVKLKDGSYFVWIPRFAYKITGSGNSTKINVVFLKDTTNNYVENGVEKDATENGYIIHPAFKNGKDVDYKNGEWDSEIPGIWVAKYAAGFQGATQTIGKDGTITEPEVPNIEDLVKSNINYSSYHRHNKTNFLGQQLIKGKYNSEPLTFPVFKPLTYAYNVISIDDSYKLSSKVSTSTTLYGLKSKQIDSHLMKNSEWGAVAYLTWSEYGRNGEEVAVNSMCLNNIKMIDVDGSSINSNIYAITGYGYNKESGKNEPNYVGASSTNNEWGIFDLNGCVSERVAAYISNGEKNLSSWGKVMTSENKSTKYVTVYSYNKGNDSGNENFGVNDIYGDAIAETSTSGIGNKAINDENSYYPNSTNPFFMRGGYYYNNKHGGGIFAYDNTFGFPVANASGFRVTLIVK